MSYYNLSNLTTDSYNPMLLTQEVNKLSGHIFGLLILVALLVIMIVAFKNNSPRGTMPIISFILTLISIPMAVMELIPDVYMFILIIATAGFVIAGIFINPEG